MRSVPEWIGKNDDAKIPDRVKQRVLDRHNGTCHYCKCPILTGSPWEADHLVALATGGEHRENNLAPIHKDPCHKTKTKADKAAKSKIAAVRARHTGVKQPEGKLQSRGFPKAPKPVRVSRPSLPPRQLYARGTE